MATTWPGWTLAPKRTISSASAPRWRSSARWLMWGRAYGPGRHGAGFAPGVTRPRRCSEQDAGVEDSRRVELALDRPQGADGELADFAGVELAVVATHAVVVGDRGARIADGAACRLLDRPPLGHRILGLRAADREVQRR